MTGLIPTSHPFPPIWQFDVGPSTLQWEAPTSQEHRRQKKDQLSVSGLFNTLLGWLENQGSVNKPFIPSPVPPSKSGSEIVRSEALAIESSYYPVAVSEEKLEDPLPCAYLPEEIVLLRSSILDLTASDGGELESKLYSAAKTCKRSLRQRIGRGDLSVKNLLACLEPLDSVSKSHIPNAEIADKASAMIRRGILYAMADANAKNPSAISDDVWLAFVNKLCATNGDQHDIQLLWRLMHIVPAPLKDHLDPGQTHDLSCRVVTALANRHNIFAQWSTRAARFSQALQQLPTEHQRRLDHKMSIFLSQQDWLTDKAKRMRFAWLVIKAYDARMTTQEFVDMYRNCLGPGARLHGIQRWQILVARLSALQMLDNTSRKQLLQRTYSSTYQRWSTLLDHIAQSTNKDAALQETCTILNEIGDFSSTTTTLTSPPVHKIRRGTIEAMALACANHRQALELHDSIDMKPRATRARQPLWSWATWTKYIEAIIKDPEIDSSRVWQVLKLSYTPRSISENKRLLREENKAKTQLLTQMGQWFIEAQHLNDRQVLRNVQRCLNQQRALGNGVSSQILAHIVNVISRDLEKGQRGRTSRMQWLLSMVAEKHGVKEAKSAALAWKGWRLTIDKTSDRF